MFVLILLFQPGDHGRIGERRRVAQGFPLAMSRRSLRMIFPERVFGKSAAKDHVVRPPRDGADLLDDMLLELGDERFRSPTCPPSA